MIGVAPERERSSIAARLFYDLSGRQPNRKEVGWLQQCEGSDAMSTDQREIERLKPGQKLTVKEFLRRWEAMPELKFAELIDGVVYMPSPLTRKHGITDSHSNAWLATYAAYT